MEIAKVTPTMGLYQKRCEICETKFVDGDVVLAYKHPHGSIGNWVAWHVDPCMKAIVDGAPPSTTRVAIDAFIARHRKVPA